LWRFHFGMSGVNIVWNNTFLQSYIPNKWAQLSAKTLMHFWDITLVPLSHNAWPLTGRSAVHADRSVTTLQASEGESAVLVVTYSTQHSRRRPGCLLQVSNCPEPCRDVTERCRAWWAGAAWSTRLTWPKREYLLRLIVLFMDGSCERVVISTFVTNSYPEDAKYSPLVHDNIFSNIYLCTLYRT